ncbi:unnamed protein product, partial [Sphacelaria rigidula]
RQRFLQEAEDEELQRIEAQRKMQESALAKAADEAAKAAEVAAAAAARAATADAVREALEAAEKDEFRKRAKILKEAGQADHEKAKQDLAEQRATNKSHLAGRLAKRKAKAEAAKRDLEVAQREEEDRLREKHK